MCWTPSVFVWGKLLQLLAELVFLANFLAMDLVWLWMYYGITVKSLLHYLAKHHLSSHSCAQPALSTLGGCLSLGALQCCAHQFYQGVTGPTMRMRMRMSACLLTPELLGFTRLWELTVSIFAQDPSKTKHMCQFSTANCYLWDILMSCFIGISTCKAPSSRT